MMEPRPTALEQQLTEALEENRRLRESLAHAEQKIERSLAACEAAVKELQQFAYAASHDLQEPLRTISAYTELLQRYYGSNEDAREFTSFIVDAAERMTVLIRDLLTYSRTGSAGSRTMISLGAAVQWAMMNLSRSIQEAGAEIQCGELPDVVCDESQIIQVFQNLLSNALKYRSSEPPKIEISAQEAPEVYTVAVRDNGVGIAPQYHDRVFSVFQRLHGREVPGTGIGLALCRKIIEAHHGAIWVESDGEHGSVFKFTLPL